MNLLPVWRRICLSGELTGALNQHREEHSYRNGLWALLGRLRTLQQPHPAPQPSEPLLGRASTVSCGHSLECEQPGHSHQHQQGHFTEDQPSQFVWTNQTDQEKQQQQRPVMRDLSHSDLDVLLQQQPVSWRCRDPHCNVAFASDAERQLHETESHQLNVTEGVTSIDAEIETVSNTDTEGHVFNYCSNFMKMGLLERNFQDAAAEMDGERLLRL